VYGKLDWGAAGEAGASGGAGEVEGRRRGSVQQLNLADFW
jgi:hypothetical protein